MYTDLALYIDGKWVGGNGRKGEEVLNPATEKPLAHLPHASSADLDRALDAAEKGFAVWRATSAYDRAKVLRKAADLLRERHEAVARILTQEQGKVFAEARGELPSLSRPTTPVLPIPRCTSMPKEASFSATRSEVRRSSNPSSGWA